MGDLGLIPGLEKISLEKGRATHSSILAWRIPWTIYSMGCKELDTIEQLSLSLSLVAEWVRIHLPMQEMQKMQV